MIKKLSFKTNFKPFISNTSFLYPLWFSDVFRRYRKGALGILYNFNFEIHSFISWHMWIDWAFGNVEYYFHGSSTNMDSEINPTSSLLVIGKRAKRMFQNNKACQNLACFVFLKHPFWDSPFCLITDDFLY